MQFAFPAVFSLGLIFRKETTVFKGMNVFLLLTDIAKVLSKRHV